MRLTPAGVGLAILALAGCAGPQVEYVSFEVRVPVPVPCVSPLPSEPVWATQAMPRVDAKTGEGIDTAVDKLIAEKKQREGYEKQLKAATDGCR
jgi:hypothetical protein